MLDQVTVFGPIRRRELKSIKNGQLKGDDDDEDKACNSGSDTTGSDHESAGTDQQDEDIIQTEACKEEEQVSIWYVHKDEDASVHEEDGEDSPDGRTDDVALPNIGRLRDEQCNTEDELDAGEVEKDEYMYYNDDKWRSEVTKSHFVPTKERDQCQGCSTDFTSPLSRRPHHCRRCGEVFCRPCLINRKRLNVWAQPDGNGILCKVCVTCYGETETVLIGVKRSQTEAFVNLRKQCKTERRHILVDVTIDRRNASIVPALWREQLGVDIPRECQRLLSGFRTAVGSSDAYKALHELTDKIIVPSWQKAKFWTLEIAILNCRQCERQLRGQKFRNCRVCALALCKKCSFKELLIYFEEGQLPDKNTEPKLAIIKVPGSPEKEPRFSLRLTVCGTCREDLVARQSKDHTWYSRLGRPPEPDLMAHILGVDQTFRDLMEEAHQGIERLGELQEIQMTLSRKEAKAGLSAATDQSESKDTNNTVNCRQEITSNKERVQSSLARYYKLYQDLKVSISQCVQQAPKKQRNFADNYIQARHNSYILLRSKESSLR